MNEVIYLESLQSAYEYLPKLKKGIKRYITLYHSSESTAALELLGLIVDGLDWVVNIISRCDHLLNKDVNAFNQEETKAIVKDFLLSIENNDETLTLEILEHEILNLLDKWYKSIEKIVNSEAN